MLNPKSLPDLPGVYIYKNVSGEIIYVGKAINLKKRVLQYFERDDALGPKTKSLVSQIAKIEYRIVGSEIEALVLEARLIKKHNPKYNSQLKDDKSYLYICITKDKLPRIFTAFRSKLNPDWHSFGPFPSASSVRSLLKTIRKIFPFYGQKAHPKTECLYCHLGLCPGPTPNPRAYKNNIKKIKNILTGKFKSLTRQLEKEMHQTSKLQNYESAIKARDQLQAINYIVQGWSSLHHLYENINFPEDETSSAVSGLKTILNPYFEKMQDINRLECFDISNLGSNYFVGSMIVFQNGRLDKSQYRKFKIYSKQTPDDQLMIKEVVYRRLKHLEWPYPQIILVDGGKPQVSAAKFIVGARVSGPIVIGLAKKYETIVFKVANNWVEVNLPSHSNTLKLLELLRNEAHRFANKYRKELMRI